MPEVRPRCVSNDTARAQHLTSQIRATRRLQVPPHGPEDDLGREAAAAARPGGGHGRCSRRRDRWERHSYPLTTRRSTQRNPPRMTSAGQRQPRNARASVINSALGWEGRRAAPTRSRCPAQRNGSRPRSGSRGTSGRGSCAVPRIGGRWERPLLPAHDTPLNATDSGRLLPLPRGGRQGDGEGRALAALALDRHVAAEQAAEVPRDR
jgi:hypothetical protein